jgi:hypothetical protein
MRLCGYHQALQKAQGRASELGPGGEVLPSTPYDAPLQSGDGISGARAVVTGVSFDEVSIAPSLCCAVSCATSSSAQHRIAKESSFLAQLCVVDSLQSAACDAGLWY